MAKVYLDPGHGGSDSGAVKYINERDTNLVMSLACRDYLKSHGVDVKMSRTSNSTGTSISSMARDANRWGADLVVSIHNNAGGGDGLRYTTLLAAARVRFWRQILRRRPRLSDKIAAA